jgi:hypothetical protein
MISDPLFILKKFCSKLNIFVCPAESEHFFSGKVPLLLKENVPWWSDWLPVGAGVGWLGGAEPCLLGRHLPRVPGVQGVLPQEELHAPGGCGAVGQAPAAVRISHRWAKLIVTSFLSISSTNPISIHPRCPMKKKCFTESRGDIGGLGRPHCLFFWLRRRLLFPPLSAFVANQKLFLGLKYRVPHNVLHYARIKNPFSFVLLSQLRAKSK